MGGSFASPAALAVYGAGCVAATLLFLSSVSALAGQARRFFSPAMRVWANRATGAFLIGFACKMLLDLLNV